MSEGAFSHVSTLNILHICVYNHYAWTCLCAILLTIKYCFYVCQMDRKQRLDLRRVYLNITNF